MAMVIYDCWPRSGQEERSTVLVVILKFSGNITRHGTLEGVA